MPKAKGYIVLYSEVPGPENLEDWRLKTFSRTRGLILNLKSGAKYVFKAAAISPEASKSNHFNYTSPVERITQ